MKSNWPTMILSTLLLLGCKANQESLHNYVQQIEQSASSQIQSLAPAMSFQASRYSQQEPRQPFVLPQAALVVDQPLARRDCWQPTPRHKSGKLERYPLQKLKLRGMMGSEGDLSALVQTPQGEVAKVRAGQYIGLNNGKVTSVSSNRLVIKETLPDGLGCWSTRMVTLALK
ncbi:pilus assembly protein PilP [Vibrio astriarenae]|uniref:pilus assembly protein PilP n=1 Tax=Vibrio astriarenae TaxID=1481923 RepID=UPI0037360F6C